MDPAYLSALSALAGSVVGGLTSGLTTWMSVRTQARAGRLANDMDRRQDLFRDFIVAASKTYGTALRSNDPNIDELVALYAMMNRMRVLCSQDICRCADRVLRLIVDTYFSPNKTIDELHELMKAEHAIDPLKDFSEAARHELKAFAVL